MKLVTLRGRIPKFCERCNATISEGDECWRVSSSRRTGIRGLNFQARKYYCKKCGNELQH